MPLASVEHNYEIFKVEDMLDAKIPAGTLEDKWTDYKGHCKLVN